MAMAGRNGDSDPETDPNFWAIRNSLLPATPEMERAADLLNEAADMVLADRDEEACQSALNRDPESACKRDPYRRLCCEKRWHTASMMTGVSRRSGAARP